MKKLFLAAAAVMMTLPAFSAKWAVVGAYTTPGWNFEASTVLEGDGDVLTCEIAKLTSDFKIVDIDVTNWSVQCGTATPLVIGEPIVLTVKEENGPDPANITFANNVQVANNAKVTFTVSTKTLLVESSDLVISLPELYATGSFNNWTDPGNDQALKATEKDGIYTVTFDLGDAEKTEFKLAGKGWSNEIAGGVEVNATEAAQVTRGGGNLFTTLTGTQTLTFNYNTMKMTFGDPELTNDATVLSKWAVVGAYSDPAWDFPASTLFEGDGDVLTCEIAELTPDFKIVDIINNSWATQFGSATPLVIGEPLELTGKEADGPDPANIRFANNVQLAKNAKLTFTVSTKTLLVESTDLTVALPELYVTGSFCSWAEPGSDPALLATHTEDGVYTVTFDLLETEDIKEFKLAGPGWTNEIAGGVEVTDTAAANVTVGGANLTTPLTGIQTLTFNINTMKMTFGNPELTNPTDMVTEIETADAPVEYYNLQGVRVLNPANGLYIIKQGNKVTKSILR